MKTPPKVRSVLCKIAVAAAILSSVPFAEASPYASGVTNNNGTVQFFMNEAGATVNVIFEDNTTNAMGVLPKGATNFLLGAHTSYQIICTKLGNGTPALISSDTGFCVWNSPRGVDVNKNAKLGNLFGRVYIGNTGANATRQWGIYGLTPDLSANAFFPAPGTNAMTATVTVPPGSTNWVGHWAPDANAVNSAGVSAPNTSGPYRMTIAPDNSLYVTDFGTPGGGLWQFGPNFEFTNLVLYPVGENQGIAAGTHGDPIGVFTTGSLATGDLKVFTADPGLGAPGSAVFGDTTSPGDYNDLFRYDIGSGPLPWSNAPNFAVNLGLPGFFDSQTLDLTLETNGYLVGLFRRANLSDGCIQVFDPDGHRLYTSLHDGGDVFQNAYAGVRISPDGRFLATMTINNAILVANMVNGIPDESSLVTIANTPTTVNARGIAWDAADNLYVCSSGQGLLRVYSLGITTTAITSNDVTGTNGSFQLIVPNYIAGGSATQPLASQNYINNPTPGTPIPGVFTITLNQTTLTNPVSVNFTRTGTAFYLTNYTMNLGPNANGVVIGTNSATFPVGTFPGVGNWSADVQIIPTATPVIGPTLTATIKVTGGSNYLAQAPLTGTIAIANTGPQLLVLSAAASGTTMNRGIPNDNAQYRITRLGDTNGPGNSAGSVLPKTYTVTNFTYLGTAAFPADYAAQSQRLIPGNIPVNGTPGIVINPGDVTVTALVGNPVSHVNLTIPPTNLTVIINLTNSLTGTNLTTLEGYPYFSSNNVVTLTEIDNTVGPEVVLWSSSLTNSLDSTNWTLTFASTNMASTPVLPVQLPNYTNGFTEIANGGTNDFDVQFGFPVANDGVSPSPVMSANGWTSALRMTVNKNSFSPAGVNVFPQGLNFKGNYALRFNMYLSLYQFGRNNPNIGNASQEFAAFGINHRGTNCDWRLPTTIAAGSGSSPTNADGVWFAINAGTTSLTPADFDGFASPALPNSGVSADLVSNTTLSQNGVFKKPPFNDGTAAAGGSPVDKWVDVSVEVTRQTNVSLFMDRSLVLGSFAITNGGNYTNGTPMLGYLDPLANVSDGSAFVYYSNVRVVELSPYIYTQPLSRIVLPGTNFSITAAATYATAPLTNTWSLGGAAPAVAVQTDTINDTNLTSTLSLTNVLTGTNYYAVFSDSAGSVTSLVVNVEVIAGPNNVTTNAGTKANIAVVPTGQAAPTLFQWRTNGVTLANGNKYTNVATATLSISNAQPADAAVAYSCLVSNAFGVVITPSATLTVIVPPSSVVVAPASQTNLWGSTASFTVSAAGTAPLAYRWKRAGTNLSDGGNISGATTNVLTLSNLTSADAATYTAGVTNAAGGAVSSAGVLTVAVPPPTFSTVSVAGGNVVLSFSSTNSFDTTNAFILLSSPVVTGPYTNTPASFILTNGAFQVTAPQTDPTMFYRLQHAN